MPGDLQRELDAQACEIDRSVGIIGEEEAQVIRELELMDDLIENSQGEPLCALFDEVIQFSSPARLDEQQAEAALKPLLARLALYGIAFDICEHFTTKDAYRLLVERLCREENAFPGARGTQWVQHFCTSDFCGNSQSGYEPSNTATSCRRSRTSAPDFALPYPTDVAS